MLSLQFPPMEKLLGKNTGELENDDPKKGVCVINNHAFAIMDQGVVFFDLEDYFVKKFNFISEVELKELRNILDFMNGKMFNPFFWKELTALSAVGIADGSITLDGIIKKDVYYTEQLFDHTELKMLCSSLKDVNEMAKATNNIFMEPLYSIMTALKPFIKEDNIILRTVGVNTPIHFTFDENPWIYGVVMTSPGLSERQFLFEPFYDFAKEIS